jgi:M6 family metalloprotease-like protein
MKNLLKLTRPWRAGLSGLLLLALTGPALAQSPTLADFGHGRLLSRTTWPLLVVMVEFTDRTFPNNTTNWWDGFSFNVSNAPPGIAAYFSQVSLGRFAWTRGGVIHFTESPTNRWAGWNARLTNNAGLHYHSNLIYRAITTAPGVFAAHDLSGNGYVTRDEMQIVFLMAGEGGQAGNSVKVRPAGMTGWDGSMATANVQWAYGLHIICHELAHMLGTIDLYGVWGTDQDLHKELSVMGAGQPDKPVHLDPWHKLHLGWTDPRIIPLSDGGVNVIPAAQMQHPNAPLLYYDPHEGTSEYWLLEYRTQVTSGNDAFETYVGEGGDGLLIWHVRQNANHTAPLYGTLAYPDASAGWLECKHCQGLYYKNASNKNCPSTNSVHEPLYASDDHRIVRDKPDEPGQQGWRYCTKCGQLFYGPAGNAGVCPAGGQHAAASYNHTLLMDTPEIVGHNNWRRCTQCQVSYFPRGSNHGVCPAGGAHLPATNTYVLVTGWGELAMLTESHLVWNNEPRFLLGGNGFWPTNSATPYLTFFDRRPTRYRIEVGDYFQGRDGLVVKVVGDAFVDFSYAGVERGSSAQPYNTFLEGVTNVSPGANVYIRRGNTPETGRVVKPMRVWADEAPVTIGRP